MIDLTDVVAMTSMILTSAGLSAASVILAYDGGPLIGVVVLLVLGLWATGVTGVLIGSVMNEEDR